MGSYTGTPPTFLAGELPDADKFVEITNFMTAFTSVFTDFSSSFTITATSVNPTKNNSTYSASYVRVGKLVIYNFAFTIGSSFSAGTGAYRFLLPVTASAAAVVQATGAFWVNDSGTALRVGTAQLVDTTHAEAYISNITANALGAAGPGTAWATGDGGRASIVYEAA